MENLTENLIGIAIIVTVVIFFMFIMGKCLENDLKEIEKTNPKYRKKLKDKYGF